MRKNQIRHTKTMKFFLVFNKKIKISQIELLIFKFIFREQNERFTSNNSIFKCRNILMSSFRNISNETKRYLLFEKTIDFY